jgi:hypothetical protein
MKNEKPPEYPLATLGRVFCTKVAGGFGTPFRSTRTRIDSMRLEVVAELAFRPRRYVEAEHVPH